MTINFNSYTKGYEWLSNFHLSPIEYGDTGKWPSVEHAYQAAKTRDQEMREMIRAARTASIAKRLGKRCDIVPYWEGVKLNVMTELIAIKFTPGCQLGAMLLATGESLLYHLAPWDTFWGVNERGRGENHLGRIIMEQRRYLLLRDTKL